MKLPFLVMACAFVANDACPHLDKQGSQVTRGLNQAPHPIPHQQHQRRLFFRNFYFGSFVASFWQSLLNSFRGGGRNNTAPPTNVQEAIAAARADITADLNSNLAAKFLRLAFHDCVRRLR